MMNIMGDVNCEVQLMVLKYIHMGKNLAWHDEKSCSQGSLCLQDLVRIKLSVSLPLFKCLHRISRVLPWLALWRRQSLWVNLFIMYWFCLSGLCSLNIPIDPTGDMTLRLEVVMWLGLASEVPHLFGWVLEEWGLFEPRQGRLEFKGRRLTTQSQIGGVRVQSSAYDLKGTYLASPFEWSNPLWWRRDLLEFLIWYFLSFSSF